MIYVQKHPSQKTFPVGFWPIPEPYWPDPKATSLPARDAHPKIKIITPCCDEPQLVRNFPIDKYELEPSPLTLQILSKKETNKIWPLMVSNGIHGMEMPFGYLKANSTLTVVHLYVLPYNYQMFLPLVNDLFHKYNLNPPNDWIYKFTNYVKAIPQYYCPFLRRALCGANVPYQLLQYILPENLDSYLSPAVANYLKQMKNTAKQDQENLCLRVFKQLKQPKPPYHQVETVKLNCGLQLKRDLISHPMLKDTFSKIHSEINVFDNYPIVVPTMIRTSSTKNYRNPFDIPRRDLIDEIARMRENFFKLPTNGISLYTKDAGHCLPIAEMGNYQEYLKNKETPLRELEPTNVRQHMFGNPYKKDKNMVMVDEADLGDVAPVKSPNKKFVEPGMPRMSRKRKAGPIRKDFIFKRSSSSSSIASSSSISDAGSVGSDRMLDFATDDDNSSDASSVLSDMDDDNDRLIVDLFNETEEMEPQLNGDVEKFINGLDINDQEPGNEADIDEINVHMPDASEVLDHAPHHQTAPTSMLHHHIYPLPPVMQHPIIPPYQPSIPPVAPVVVVAAPPPPVVPIVVPPAPTTTTSTTSAAISNDLSYTLEISNILKTCHNGDNSHYPPFDDDQPLVNGQQDDKNSDKSSVHFDDGESKQNGNLPNEMDNDDADEEDGADDEEKENIRINNNETRTMIFKDIRRPGRDYSALLEHLELVKGNFETKFNFIQMCIGESLRFRRKKMADSIQEWWENQVDNLRWRVR